MGLTFFFLLVAGCAKTGRQFEAMRVNLVNLKVQEITIFETSFLIELRVFNRNDFSIPVKATDCKLELSGRDFAFGVSDENVKISVYSHAVIPIVVYSSVIDMIKGLMNLKEKEKLEYKISGKLYLEKGFSLPPTIPFQSEGKLSLQGID